jgi:prevent-host-death family protein
MVGAAEEVVGVTRLKARSNELVAGVASERLSRVVLTKRGKPAAMVVPVRTASFASLHGALRHLLEPVPGGDLTEPAGEVWDVERD